MAIIKHIKSRNANYSDALDYLLFQHDEKTNLPILDEQGRKQLRNEFYMDGLNCDAMFFDTECKKTNAFFHKNKKRNDIKSHHYIISFDPADATECGLTGERAQELCLEFVKKNFPGYQALIVTHTDGHNNSGNIHTHIVINSVRKFAVERAYYMDKPHEESAGYKHRSTTKFLRHLQKEVMEMCEKEGLHQINLFSPAPEKMTKEEYWVKTHGQEKLDKLNQEIISDGLQPVQTTFQTQKQFLRDAIDECARISKDFEDFQSQLLEKYNISVIQQRGTYRYLHPNRSRRITEKSLGSNYGKEYLEQLFTNYEKTQTSNLDYHKDPFVIFYIKSELRLVTDLQSNIKAMQNEAYELVALYNQSYTQKTLENIASLPHPTVQKFTVITAAIVGASRRFLSQITRHQNEVKFMSASLQYSNYSNLADFVIPYEIMAASPELQELYLKSCQSDLHCYQQLCEMGIHHDSAGYVTPHGLRNILIISATPYQWKHMIGQRTCRRNTDEMRIVMLYIWKNLYELSPALFDPRLTGPFCQRSYCLEGKMSCGIPIDKILLPGEILHTDYPLLSGGTCIED